MRTRTETWIVGAGYVVLAAVVAVLLSMAFLRGGHPPGSGIVNLIILVVVYPISLYAAVAGLKTRVDAVSGSPKRFFVMVGVSLTFSVFVSLLFVLKFAFGRSI